MEKIIHVLLRMGLLIFLAKKPKALDTVREENYNLLESINDFEVYQWLQMSILAVSMWTTKEKNTLVSLQHASPHLLSILQPLPLHSVNYFIHCNKPVTIKKAEWMKKEEKKDGFKYMSQTHYLNLWWHLSSCSWEQHDWNRFSLYACPSALSLSLKY